MHYTRSLSQTIRRSGEHIIKRGFVHCCRDEYSLAVNDFIFALRESCAVRKARQTHAPSFRTQSERSPKGKRKKSKVNGQAPQNGTSAASAGRRTGWRTTPDSSVSFSSAPNPIEPQLLFHRGAAYLAHAVFLIKEEMYKIEGVQRASMSEFGENFLTLRMVDMVALR